jgi:hypothetical protein
MPIILVFDTETTGFTPLMKMSRKTAEERRFVDQLKSELFSITPRLDSWSKWSPKWNDIIQISYILYDTETNEFTPFDEYIDLPQETVHTFLSDPDAHYTITNALKEQQKAVTMGKTVPLQVAIERFLEAYKSATIVVGHNVEYDKNMVLAELMHLHLSADTRRYLDEFVEMQSSKKFVCTADMGTDICKIESKSPSGKSYYKFPRLNQLYEHLFGYPPVDSKLHNALNDVIVTFRCYYFITYDEDIYGKNPEIDDLIESITPARLLTSLGKGLKKGRKLKSKKSKKSIPDKKSKKTKKLKKGKKSKSGKKTRK